MPAASAQVMPLVPRLPRREAFLLDHQQRFAQRVDQRRATCVWWYLRPTQ